MLIPRPLSKLWTSYYHNVARNPYRSLAGKTFPTDICNYKLEIEFSQFSCHKLIELIGLKQTLCHSVQ